MRKWNGLFVGAAAAAMFGLPAMAQQYTNDFSGAPGAASLYGFANVNGGSVQLTDEAVNSSGAMVLNTWAEGATAFTASFDFLFTYPFSTNFPADGLSFNLGVLPSGVVPGASENGPGNGLTVSLDLFDYDNNGIVQDAGIRVLYNGAEVAGAPNAITQFGDSGVFRAVTISLAYNGNITVTYNGNTVINNAPTGFVPQAGQRFGFAARTGGSFSAHRIDNVTVTPYYNRPSCSGSAAIRGDGVWGYSYDAVGSATEGNASCVGTNRDVWFCWQATTDGTATMTTDGLTDDDSVISAYAGCQPCPGNFGELACNDDIAGPLNRQSLISFPVKAGGTYTLRVALFGANDGGASGLEAFRITTAPSCPADFNNSGMVSVQDIFDYLAAYFAGCP